mmetsp:Transcript_125460/g.349169  ORF Transcript_125460/g.349169 Transcript_125460/m.349169 type:complete len:200 (+) Transcript_125460:1967-2566(+)
MSGGITGTTAKGWPAGSSGGAGPSCGQLWHACWRLWKRCAMRAAACGSTPVYLALLRWPRSRHDRAVPAICWSFSTGTGAGEAAATRRSSGSQPASSSARSVGASVEVASLRVIAIASLPAAISAWKALSDRSVPEALKPPFCIANSLLVLLPEAPPPLAALATSLCRPRQVFVGRALNHSSQEEGPASNNARCRASKS